MIYVAKKSIRGSFFKIIFEEEKKLKFVMEIKRNAVEFLILFMHDVLFKIRVPSNAVNTNSHFSNDLCIKSRRNFQHTVKVELFLIHNLKGKEEETKLKIIF